MRIVIDGNIGSGKTTQLGLLEQKGVLIQREPIELWPLVEFYEDPKRWAYLLHNVILQTLKPLATTETVVYERSVVSSRHVFWPVLVRCGCVTPCENSSYVALYDAFAWRPDIYILLKKDVVLAFEHISSRHQAGDSGITLEYLYDLEAEYNKMPATLSCEALGLCRVYTVDADQSIGEIHKEICRILEENELFVDHAVGS